MCTLDEPEAEHQITCSVLVISGAHVKIKIKIRSQERRTASTDCCFFVEQSTIIKEIKAHSGENETVKEACRVCKLWEKILS